MKIQQLKQKLDYDKIVKGEHLDHDTYNQKFKMWDYLVQNDLTTQPEAISLLNDLTVYAYAFFKDRFDKPMRLTAYQDAIANCKHDFTFDNPNRFIVFKASNQIGKSQLLACMAIHHVMMQDNVNVVIVSRSLPQSQDVLRTVRQVLNTSVFSETWRDDIGETANTTVLTIQRDNGKVFNRIICAPSGEGLLGYPVHYLYLDEADFYEGAQTFFWKVAYPRTNTTKGQIILFSNPNADIARDASLLWEVWNKDMFKRKFTFNFLDAPWNTRADYKIAKENSPSRIFASTHGGEFSQDSGSYFSQTEIDDMMQQEWHNQLPIVKGSIYMGLDLAKVYDRSVLTIGMLTPNIKNPKVNDLEVRYILEFAEKTDYDVIVNRVADIIKFYKEQGTIVARVGFDVTGVGKAVEDMIKLYGVRATPVTFSLQSKSKMYTNFKMLAEQRRIKIVYNKNCKLQLSNLVFSKSANGFLQVRHAKESQRDDIPDSISALIDVSICPSTVPVTATLVDSKGKVHTLAGARPNPMADYDKYVKGLMQKNREYVYGDPNKFNMGFDKQW